MTTAVPTYTVELKDLPARHTLSVRFHSSAAEMPQRLGEAFGAVFGYLAELGVEPASPPYAAYYSLAIENVDAEGGCQVATALPGRGAVQPGQIPAGEQVSCRHVGPYAECAAAYGALTEWMAAHGREATGVAYEFYLNDPAVTAPEELLTEIVFPLKGA
jgi:effector-binding domain-containing protein